MRLGWVLGIGILLLGSCEESARASSPQPKTSRLTSVQTPASYCGIHSLYRAASCLGRAIVFQDLLKPKYISSRQGSSLADLIQAARDQGFYVEPLGHMTCIMLSYVDCPVILHVKNDLVHAKDYNHWVLFAGMEGSKARLYDGVRPVELVDMKDLAARWDGVALLISDAPIRMSYLWLVFVAYFTFYCGAGAAIILSLLRLQCWIWGRLHRMAWWRCWGSCVGEVLLPVVLAAILGIGFCWTHTGGFLSSAGAIASLQDRYLGSFLPRVSVTDLPSFLQAEDVVIVDARRAADFALGHLPRARNIPPDASEEDCRRILADVSRSQRLLIYCQSNGCPYSVIVARKLLALGYVHILYFRDGWHAWQEYQRYLGS
jgi:rhodanese-related sulfurtransferase